MNGEQFLTLAANFPYVQPKAASTNLGRTVAAVPESQTSPPPSFGSILMTFAPAALASDGSMAAGKTMPEVPTWITQSQ